MLALVSRGEGQVELALDHPRPVPAPGWAVVRVLRAGICTTDLELIAGYLDFQGVLGHEFCGVVEESPGDRWWEGRRVVGEINIACGECGMCRQGMGTHCERRRVLGIRHHDGAFATHLALPLANLHEVPADLPDDVAVFTEPVAAALEIAEGVHLRPTATVYILGDGKLGLLVAQVLRLTGADCTLVGRHVEKLALAEGWGLETALVARADDSTATPDLPPADLVIDCTGNPAGLRLATALLRPRGTLVLKSTFHGEAPWNSSAFVVNEQTLVGSRCGPFPPALRLLRQGLIATDALVDAVYPLRDGVGALAHAARPGTLKVLLRTEE